MSPEDRSFGDMLKEIFYQVKLINQSSCWVAWEIGTNIIT